jgi:hypothetical protein
MAFSDAWPRDAAQPVLKEFKNIKCDDAILAYDREELARDAQGQIVTRWDGHSTRLDLATGRDVPDESKQVELYRYVNPRPAGWPDADFIIGNPPFIGTKRVRDALGDGYVDALAQAYPDMPRNTDFVMFWWRRAADLVRNGRARRFGLITTNSLPQVFNRKVVAAQLEANKSLSIIFAIPDHPWYLGGDMAAVRIAMTVGVVGKQEGQLFLVVDPRRNAARGGDALQPPIGGLIRANLTFGVDTDTAKPLLANQGLCRQGVKLGAPGFIVSSEQAKRFLNDRTHREVKVVHPYLRNKDVTGRPRDTFILDLYGINEREAINSCPEIYQFLLDHVKASRQQSRRPSYRKKW